MLPLILVDFNIHVNINVSHGANLGARSSLFITNTTANRNCDTDINRNTSIYTSMAVSNTKAIQLKKYNYNYQCNTKTFTNRSCQYNTENFTNISKHTSTKNSICINTDTNNDIKKFFKQN